MERSQSDGRAHEQEWSSGPARIPRLPEYKRQTPFTIAALVWILFVLFAVWLAI